MKNEKSPVQVNNGAESMNPACGTRFIKIEINAK